MIPKSIVSEVPVLRWYNGVKNMKKYYAVCTSCYDSGRITANLVDTIEAEEKPENTYKETKRCDIYIDWFDSYDEAMEFIRESKMA